VEVLIAGSVLAGASYLAWNWPATPPGGRTCHRIGRHGSVGSPASAQSPPRSGSSSARPGPCRCWASPQPANLHRFRPRRSGGVRCDARTAAATGMTPFRLCLTRRIHGPRVHRLLLAGRRPSPLPAPASSNPVCADQRPHGGHPAARRSPPSRGCARPGTGGGRDDRRIAGSAPGGAQALKATENRLRHAATETPTHRARHAAIHPTPTVSSRDAVLDRPPHVAVDTGPGLAHQAATGTCAPPL
jgi:hypothetical protein